MSTPALIQQAPYSQEAEEAVLGAVMINPESFLAVASFLTADDFFILRHGYIWEAMTRIVERNDRLDTLTVQEELRAHGRLNDIGGPAYLMQLINNTPTSVHAEVYGRLVERAALRRRLLTAADEIKSLAMDETLTTENVTSEAESRLFRVTERNLRRDIIPMREAVIEYYDKIEHLMQHQDEPLGLPTGFRDMDELLGGLQRSDLLVFAGRPGMGKCVAAGTLIATADGLKPIEALKPTGVDGIEDDEGGVYYPLEIGVQTPNGLKQTAYFYDSGVKPTLRIQTRAGYSLSGTHVHPVLTLSKLGEEVWKPLGAVVPGDFVAVVQRQAPVSTSTHLPVLEYKRTPSYAGLHQVAAPEAYALLEPAFYWDEITSVEDSGLQHCYDLTVPDGHAFVSNGIVSHNTSFLLSVALNAAKLGARIAIFTMEMGADQIVQRFVSMETGINTQKLRLGQLTPQEWQRFVQASGRLGNLQIFIDDSPSMTPLQMRTKCRRLSHEFGLDLIILDYIQLMNAGSGYENNRVQEISYISRNLKELARELNVPLFSAAQLSRAVEQRQDKRPQLSDLRESGAIEQDSDVVIFLYRDVVYNEATEFPNRADLIIAKHRNGPTGIVSLHFEKSLTKFSDARTSTIDLSNL
jgi:replicative DNA helicase